MNTKNNRESIGQTINRFETMPQQNIGTFNELFPNCQLTGFSPELSVVIGEYNKGLRTVIINDTITLEHEFSHIDYTLGDVVVSRFILFDANGETIGKFNSFTDAAREIGLSTYLIKSYISTGKIKIKEL